MNPWQQFFDRYATRYDDEPFTKNTDAEVEFLLEHTRTPDAGAILDLGCGTGRHSVPLASRGYNITGVDISQGMLGIAATRAQDAGVEIDYVRADAADFVRPAAFDTVICLCEGAMCLLTDADDPLERDMKILRNIHASLKPGGALILNVLSALRVIRNTTEDDLASGRFDPLAMTEQSDVRELLPDAAITGRLRERFYTAPELHRMAEQTGLTVNGVYGGTAGAWALRPVTLDDYELMLIATK